MNTWITRVEIEDRAPAIQPKPGETLMRSFGPYDKPISDPTWNHGLEGWDYSVARLLRLFEISDPKIEGECRLVLRVVLKTHDAVKAAYPEIRCRFPDGHETTSTKPSVTAGSNADWTTYDVTMSLKKGEKPDLIRLNIVVARVGLAPAQIEVRDVMLLKAPPLDGKQ